MGWNWQRKGAAPPATDKPRLRQLTVNVPTAEYAQYEREAAAAGITLSELVRRRLRVEPLGERDRSAVD